MDSRTLTNHRGQARGELMRLERQLDRAKENLRSAVRNRIVGGVILLIGVIALIQFNVLVGVVVSLIGAWVFVRALLKVGQERHSIDTMTGRVSNASAKLAELKAQSPTEE